MLTDVPHLYLVLMLALGLSFGVLLKKARLSPALGFLLSGLTLGFFLKLPGGLSNALSFLSEVSILLLFFEIGFEIHVTRLNNLSGFPLYISLLELSLAVPMTVGSSVLFGFNLTEALILGLIGSFSSTVFTYKLLEEIKPEISDVYRTVLMVAAVEDIIIVVALAMISGGANPPTLFITELLALAIALFFIFLEFSRKVLSKIIKADETGLILLITYGLLAGVITSYIGLGPAFGAFIAGLTTSSIKSSKKLMKMFKPVRAVFLDLFLISMGITISSTPLTSTQFVIVVAISLILSLIHAFSTVFSSVSVGGLGLKHGLEAGFYLSTLSELALVISYYSYLEGLASPYIMSVAALSILFGSVNGSLLVNHKRKIIDSVIGSLTSEITTAIDGLGVSLRGVMRSPAHTILKGIFRTVMHSVGEILLMTLGFTVIALEVNYMFGSNAALITTAALAPLATYVLYRLTKRIKAGVHALLQELSSDLTPVVEPAIRNALYVVMAVVTTELASLIILYHYGTSLTKTLGSEGLGIISSTLALTPALSGAFLIIYLLMHFRKTSNQ